MAVISVDREPRFFSRIQREWCPIVDFYTEMLSICKDALHSITSKTEETFKSPRVMFRVTEALVLGNPEPAGSGKVRVLEGNLMNLSMVESHSVDAVVSISSLEHNTPEDLRVVVGELRRVLKPGGKFVATLAASDRSDWFHEPSRGWCYTEATFRNIFGLNASTTSNFDQYPALLEEVRTCEFLRTHLSTFYFRSDNNGMPWARWDPKDMSAGVMQTKAV